MCIILKSTLYVYIYIYFLGYPYVGIDMHTHTDIYIYIHTHMYTDIHTPVTYMHHSHGHKWSQVNHPAAGEARRRTRDSGRCGARGHGVYPRWPKSESGSLQAWLFEMSRGEYLRKSGLGMLGTSWDIQSMCGGMRRDRFVVQKYGNTTGTSWDACIQQFVIRVTGSSEKAFVSLPIYCLESISVISWNILHQWHQQSYMGLYAAIESLNEDIYIYYCII